MNISEEEWEMARANNFNCDEGQLGGYIRASSEPAPSGLKIEHGDPAKLLALQGLDARGMLRAVRQRFCNDGVL